VQENPVGTLNAELEAKEADTFAGLWLEHNPEKVIVAFTHDGKKTVKPYLKYRTIPNLELLTARITQAELVETSSRLYQFFQQ
jgi:hypothetical protein